MGRTRPTHGISLSWQIGSTPGPDHRGTGQNEKGGAPGARPRERPETIPTARLAADTSTGAIRGQRNRTTSPRRIFGLGDWEERFFVVRQARRQLAGSQALGVFGRAVATELVLVWEGGARRACIFLSFPLFILIDLYVKGAINRRRVQREVSASSDSCIVTRLGVKRCLSTADQFFALSGTCRGNTCKFLMTNASWLIHRKNKEMVRKRNESTGGGFANF